jgi:hypothetical protein
MNYNNIKKGGKIALTIPIKPKSFALQTQINEVFLRVFPQFI